MEAEKRMKVDAGKNTRAGEKLAPEAEALALEEAGVRDWLYPSIGELLAVERCGAEADKDVRILGYVHARMDAVKAINLWIAWAKARGKTSAPGTQTLNTTPKKSVPGETMMEAMLGEEARWWNPGRDVLRVVMVQYARMALEEAHGVPDGMLGRQICLGWRRDGKRIEKTWEQILRILRALGRKESTKRRIQAVACKKTARNGKGGQKAKRGKRD